MLMDEGQDSERELALLAPGQYFGEMSALGGYPRSATAVAAEDGTRRRRRRVGEGL